MAATPINKLPEASCLWWVNFYIFFFWMSMWARNDLKSAPKKGLYSSLTVGFNFVEAEEKPPDLWVPARCYKRSPLCLADLNLYHNCHEDWDKPFITHSVPRMRSDNSSIVIIGGRGSTAVEHRIKTKAFHLFFPIGKKVMPDMHLIMKAELASKSNCRFPVRLYPFHRSLLPSTAPSLLHCQYTRGVHWLSP